MIVEVAINLPLRQTFDYAWPENFQTAPQPGLRVLVPFGTNKKSGIVVKCKPFSDFPNLRPVESIVENTPIFSEHLLEFSRWVAEYYFCSWGEVLNAAIPGGLGTRLHTTYHRHCEAIHLPGWLQLAPSIQHLIEASKSWSQREWKKNEPTEQDEKLLKQWLKQKRVSRVQTLAGTKIKPKMERWTRLVGTPASSKRNPRKHTKKEQILDLLQKQSEISVSALKNHVPTPAHAIKKLKEEGLIEIFEKRRYRRFLSESFPPLEPFLPLNPHQQHAYERIQHSIEKGGYQTFMLHGVTGSGKTEVYLHAVKHAFEQGLQSLILVPEISLTPQLVNRFRSRFGDKIAVLHSGMEEGERFDEWSKIWQGEASIVVGARSAVFAPLENLGLIVVDEEHDSSYKQEEAPRYHGRDVAIYRGYRLGATVILGSATPSLESYYNTLQNKFSLLSLPARIQQAVLPEITLLNLRHCPRQKGCHLFSVQLVEALRQRLLKQEQSLLFLNRRGFATLMRCESCEEVLTCTNCSLSLVYHQSVGSLQCHQCDYTIPIPPACPRCAAKDLKTLGVGTEQVEAELKVMFPEARLLRVDKDTLKGKHRLGDMLEQIRRHEVDIVLGTQLVTKGHDFSGITLVGAIWADLSLNFPDFRSAERTFQLLTQVAGRAGRGDKTGEVLIQTYNPQHHSLHCTQTHDFEKFQKNELHIRQQLQVPPYSSMALVLFSSPKENRAQFLSHHFQKNLSHIETIDFHPMGPIEAPIKKIKNRYRWMVLLKATHVKHLHQVLEQALHAPAPLKLLSGDRISVDINPYHFQ